MFLVGIAVDPLNTSEFCKSFLLSPRASATAAWQFAYCTARRQSPGNPVGFCHEALGTYIYLH